MRRFEFLFPITIGCSMLAVSYCIGAMCACIWGDELNYFISSIISVIAISISLIMAILAHPDNPAEKTAKKRFSPLISLVLLINLAGLLLVVFSASSMEVNLAGYTFPKLLSLSRPFFIGMYTILTISNALLFGVSVKYSCNQNMKTE